MNVLEAIAGRSSVRSFRYTEIDEPTVLALLEAAVRAPSALGREPWAFVVLQDRVTLRKISTKARELWKADSPRRPAHEGAGVPPSSRLANEIHNPDFNIFHHAGTLVVIGTRAEGELADADCWLAAQNLMLAAHAHGLGSCVVGAAVPALRDPEIRTECGLPEAVRPVAPIALGVPKDPHAPRPRRAPEILAWRK